jgi:predicted nucleotidyltransferase
MALGPRELQPRNILLTGVVGSTAFGLAREGSDVDRLGIFARPTADFFTIGAKHTDSVVTTAPDSTMHEVGKYIDLALKCNPTIMDLMYLAEYEQTSWEGEWLVDIRQDFLSEPYVRSAYGGYAMGQIKRIKQELANEARQKRVAKHARHCFRLLRQGQQLLEFGTLTVKVPDPEFYWAFDEMTGEQIEKEFWKAFDTFNDRTGILPPRPRTDRLQDFINYLRKV